MNFLQQRDKLFEVLERAGHNLNIEFFGNLVHNVRYKVDYHLINARVKYYSNSKNPRVIHTKLDNCHLVSLRTHPNERYVVKTGDFLHLGPEDTLNDILQYYESTMRAMGLHPNSELSLEPQCEVGKLILFSSDVESEKPQQLDIFAGFDLNGDENLESTPAGHDSSALCKESATLSSTFQLTTASLRFDEHLRGLAEPKRQSSLRSLKREIMARFSGDDESSGKEKRRLSLRRRKQKQAQPENVVVLTEDTNLIELSDSSRLGSVRVPSKKVAETVKDEPKPSAEKPVHTELEDKRFRVKKSHQSERFFEKLGRKERDKKPWNTVYNEISLSAARLSTGSEGTSHEDYESLKSDLTDSKRRDLDVFADNLRQGKAKFLSPQRE